MKPAIKEQLNKLRTALQKDPVDTASADEACHEIDALLEEQPLPVRQKKGAAHHVKRKAA